jgi:hypothetical protein
MSDDSYYGIGANVFLNTLSADIDEYRSSIAARLKRNPGFAAALEVDAAAQRRAEEEWLQNPCLQRHVMRFSDDPSQRQYVPFDTKYSDDNLDALLLSLIASDKLHAIPGLFSASERDKLFALSALAHKRAQEENYEYSDDEKRLLNNFALRVPFGTNDAAFADLVHEGFISIFSTNSFRTHIPNFPFVYGIGYSNSEIIAADDVAECAISPRRQRCSSSSRVHEGADLPTSSPSQVPFLLIERTTSSDDAETKSFLLSEKLAELSPEDFLMILNQVVHALKFAYETHSFTHYDLQPKNVQLFACSNTNKVGEEDVFYIPYVYKSSNTSSFRRDGLTTQQTTSFVAARFIVRFTGLGFSHASIKNSEGRCVPFGFAAKGRAELVKFGIFRDRSNPMTDVYRLLLSCAAMIQQQTVGTSPLFECISQIVTYFNQTESLSHILAQQFKNFFYLPMTCKSRAYTFDKFIHFVKQRNSEVAPLLHLTFMSISKINSSAKILMPGNGASGVEFGPDAFSTALEMQARNGTNTPQMLFTAACYSTPKTITHFYSNYISIMNLFVFPGDDPEEQQPKKQNKSGVNESTAATLSSVLSSYTNAFIKGFSSHSSHLDTALGQAKSRAEYLSKTVIVAKKEEAESLFDDYLVLHGFSEIVELYSCIQFLKSLYWPNQNSSASEIVDTALLHISNLIKSCSSIVTSVANKYHENSCSFSAANNLNRFLSLFAKTKILQFF